MKLYNKTSIRQLKFLKSLKRAMQLQAGRDPTTCNKRAVLFAFLH